MKIEAKQRLQMTARHGQFLAPSKTIQANLQEVIEKLNKHAARMEKLPRMSPEYVKMQYIMQRLLKELNKLDPTGESIPFDNSVWQHSGKPPRQNRGLLSNTEDPNAAGVAFDTLIDGEPSGTPPAVQTTTVNDGGVEQAPEQELLNDDLVVPSIKFG
jgi:hypothetical protein